MNYINRQDKKNNAFAQYGSCVHSLLEDYENDIYAPFELKEEFVKRFADEVTEDFPYNKYTDLASKYYEDGIRFFSNFDGLDDYKIIGVEDKFEEDIDNDFILTGFIDLVLEDKNGDLILHDWKSKSGFKNKEELNKYARQLYLYSLRIYRKYGKYPDKLQFGLFRKEENLTFDFDINAYNEAIDWMKSTVHNIRYCNSFEPSTDWYFCNNLCDFREVCEYK